MRHIPKHGQRRIIGEGLGLVGRHATIFSRVSRTTMQVVRIEANFYFAIALYPIAHAS